MGKRYNFIPPQGESWKQMEERLCGALGKIISEKKSCVCVVTHAGSLRGLIPILKQKKREISLRYDFNSGSITIFDYKSMWFTEVIVNDTSHLRL